MTSNKFYIKNFGCKLNQYEGEVIKGLFAQKGYEYAAQIEKADLIIVNTCAVTKRTEQKVGKFTRRVRRYNPRCEIYLVGCLATLIDEDHEIYQMNIKFDKLVTQEQKLSFGDDECDRWGRITDFQGHTRAFVKVQDGCDNFCSYCIVPYIRGKPRSRAAEDVVAQVRQLVANGYKEVVLTGLHIGFYSFDDGSRVINLAGLLKRLLDETDVQRIRLSSVEVNEVNPELIALIKDSDKRIAHHLHLPVQSADDRILKLMRRRYDSALVARQIRDIKESVPDIQLGTDIIVGFPGEDKEAFDNTYRFLQNAPISHYHIFRYSERPGTVAAKLTDDISATEKRNRSRILRELGTQKRKDFYRSFVNSTLDVLLEERYDDNQWRGLAGNYIHCHVTRKDALSNQFVKVTAKELSDITLICE